MESKKRIVIFGEVWKQIDFDKWESLDPERTAQFIPDGLDTPTFWMNFKKLKLKKPKEDS